MSRILSSLPVGRQGQPCIWDECCHSPQAALRLIQQNDLLGCGDTALHAGRIFAVAPSVFPQRLALAGPLASRLGRLCSHPWDYPGGRYPLPFCRLCQRQNWRVSGLSSIPPRRDSGCLTQANTVIYFRHIINPSLSTRICVFFERLAECRALNNLACPARPRQFPLLFGLVRSFVDDEFGVIYLRKISRERLIRFFIYAFVRCQAVHMIFARKER